VLSDSHVIKCAHLFFNDKHRRSIKYVMNMDVSNYSLFVSHLMHERFLNNSSNNNSRRMIIHLGDDFVIITHMLMDEKKTLIFRLDDEMNMVIFK
jgi:hypothetical protein